MSEDLNYCKIKTESIILNNNEIKNDTNNLFNSKNIFDLSNILQPLKDKIEEILKNNGSYSLIACILEIFYDKNIDMLKKEEILNEIKKIMKNNSIIISINSFSENNFLNARNCFFKTNQILDYNENFMKFSNTNNNEEIIKINIDKIKYNIDSIIKELLEINNKNDIIIQVNNPEKKLEENKNNTSKEIIINIDESKNEEIDLNNNLNNNKIIKEEIINTDIFPKNKKRKRKKVLKKKVKLKTKLKKDLIKFPNTIHHLVSKPPKKFTFLSLESLSFNCNSKIEEKIYLDNKINDILLSSDKIINIFDRQYIIDIEEKKIKDLKQEILNKNKELQLHQNILNSFKKTKFNSQNNNTKINININAIKNILMKINSNYEEFKTQIDILSLYKNYIYKIQKEKKENNNFEENIELMKKIYQKHFDNCKLCLYNIEKNKNQYLLYLDNLNNFIQNINNLNTNSTGYNYCVNNNENQNINEDNVLVFIKEKECIDNIINDMGEFVELIKNNFYDCISNTPFEKELINQNE